MSFSERSGCSTVAALAHTARGIAPITEESIAERICVGARGVVGIVREEDGQLGTRCEVLVLGWMESLLLVVPDFHLSGAKFLSDCVCKFGGTCVCTLSLCPCMPVSMVGADGAWTVVGQRILVPSSTVTG